MAQTKEIRKKIGSVQNTKKITSAMELVASSKMKKTQDAMSKGKPYSKKIVELIDSLSRDLSLNLQNNSSKTSESLGELKKHLNKK